jgi:hypothetical protein
VQQGNVNMVRFCLALTLSLGPVAAARAGSWADALFDEVSRDFGSVPRGPVLSHSFRVTNKTGQPVHISNVRVSCGLCVAAAAQKADLAPGEETAVVAELHTNRFNGPKTVYVYVQFDRPQWDEVRLWMQANARDDVAMAPEAFTFGQIRRGGAPSAEVTVTLSGYTNLQVLEAKCDSNYVITSLQEQRRGAGDVAYQVTARVRGDCPAGKWYADVWLKTNHPAMARVRVPLTIDIEPALSVSPTLANLGQVKAGDEAERKVVVRGGQPFRITAVQGADDAVSVRDSSDDRKPVHVLTVRLKAPKAGDWTRTLRVVTDLPEDGVVEFQATAQVVP